MSQALYRKYRPKTFDEVYGQANITKILKNQIENQKISHAYIFSGTRGTGKTSCAKIFSRAVNCLNPIGGNPCNECENCRSILEESTMDVIEMDAASNRRIDDIRQLRDKVIYSPTDLKYKVYIIDEAHMITNEGFNALLKIMEEPPKHLIFILATTEIDRIPDTILSRTQRFDFKKIDSKVIEDRIEDILNKEGLKMDQVSINSISNIGKGSMRDALSLLDQVISIDDQEFSMDKINDILGLVGQNIKEDILKFTLAGDIKSLIELIEKELDSGKDPHSLIKEISSFYENIMMHKIGSKNENLILTPDLEGLLDKISLDRIVNSLDILLEYENTIKKSDSSSLLLKMALIRLVDYSPRKLINDRVENIEERLSRLEARPTDKSIQKPASPKSTRPKEVVEMDSQGFFEKYGDQLENKAENPTDQAKYPIEESEVVDEEKSETPIEEKVVEPIQENPQESPKNDSASNMDEKAFEQIIRNYMLKRFKATKNLFEEVKSFKVTNNTLNYWVTEKGEKFVAIFKDLIKATEDDYFRQKNAKISIVFHTHIEEEEVENEEDQKIQLLKDFFGQDKLEIKE